MQCRKSSLLLHPLFLISLFLLIANDHWWKEAYGNWITGKLSDFAGVLVWSVFLYIVLPFRRLIAVIIAGLIFAWWKSPLSEPLINALYSVAGVHFIRVVDYTDLLALVVLPFAYYVKPFRVARYHLAAKFAGTGVGVVTFLAIMATSPYRLHDYYYPPGHVWVHKTFKTKLTEEAFLEKLDSLQISWYRSKYEHLPVTPDFYYLKIKEGNDTAEHWVNLHQLKDTVLYFRKYYDAYVIPKLALEKDTLVDIRFKIWDQGRKRHIELISMFIPEGMDYAYYQQRGVRKKYLAIFQSLMLELK